MNERGISAVYIGGVAQDEKKSDEVLQGLHRLVYTSPEAILTNSTWRDMLHSETYQENLVALVVDEAHCVKKWEGLGMVL